MTRDIRMTGLINDLTYGNMVERIMAEKNIGINEAKAHLSKMSFSEYRKMSEATLIQPTNDFSTIKPTYPNPGQVKQTNIQHDWDTPDGPDHTGADQAGKVTMKMEDVPAPSGDTITPASTNTNQAATAPTQTAPSGVKSLWPGKGAPVQVGMTVGLKGPNGVPVPGQVSQVDVGAKGVKVLNPTTGQQEWTNMGELNPYMAQGGTQVQPASPNTPAQQQLGQQTQEAADLSRLLELAGIKENCSAGATGAGAIAIAPAAMGTMKKRQPTEEQLTPEYTPDGAKTVVGDTKPWQASGKLSADLAASGKKTARRQNNGRRMK